MPVDDGLSSPRPRPGARARAFGQEPGAGLGEKKKKKERGPLRGTPEPEDHQSSFRVYSVEAYLQFVENAGPSPVYKLGEW